MVKGLKNLVKKVTMLILWLKNRKNFPKKKKLSLSNILNYAEANVQHFKQEAGLVEQHIAEQAIWRLSQIKEKSPECLHQVGYCNTCRKPGVAYELCIHCKSDLCDYAVGQRCKICGCDTIELTFAKKPCEGNCFPPRMDKATWEEFKKTNKIEQIC